MGEASSSGRPAPTATTSRARAPPTTRVHTRTSSATGSSSSSPKKLGLTGKPHYLQALACSTVDARVRAEALGAAGVIEKINVATGFKPFWTTAETAKATKVLWEGLCHGAQ